MANVLNRTTKQYIRSVNTPDYPTEDWIINPDLTAVAGVANKYWKITGDVVSEMTSAEKDTSDLTNTQNDLILQIDAHATNSIQNGPGFEWPDGYDGYFSLTLNAQVKWNNLYNARATIIYPYTVYTKDDMTTYAIADSFEIEDMFEAAVDVVSIELSDATTAKINVGNAITISAAQSAADDYLNT